MSFRRNATKLVQQDQVDVIFGGIYSSTRQAIKGPAVAKGKKLYIYPEQYEGRNVTRSSSAPARSQRSRSIISYPG